MRWGKVKNREKVWTSLKQTQNIKYILRRKDIVEIMRKFCAQNLDYYKRNDYENNANRIGGFIWKIDDCFKIGGINFDEYVSARNVAAIQHRLCKPKVFIDKHPFIFEV